MAALPLPAAILDDLICGTENEVIQDGRRKRKGRHLAPHSSMGVEKAALYYSGLLSIGPLGINFSEILIKIQNFHSRKCV